MSQADHLNISMRPKSFESALEIMGWLVLAAVWLFAVWEYQNLPDSIPIHFDMPGKADEFGDKQAVFTMPVLATLLFLGLGFMQRKIHVFNLPGDYTPEYAQKQYTFATKTIRIVKIAALFILGITEVFISRWSWGLEFNLYLLLPALVIIIGIPVYYSVFKAKRNNNGYF